MKKWLEEKILNSNKKTLLLMAVFMFSFLFVFQAMLLVKGTFYNSNSDDVAQYSVILKQYIEMVKSGEFSWFNFNNNFGASVFADVYYVPLDVFSLMTFLLSFIMNPLIAFSCVELIKVFLGVLVFAYFLQKCKFNNKIVLFVSFIYFCAGGMWALSVYPTYFSLFFYLPLSLLVVHLFSEGKKWIMPLYCTVLIFYNFYNAYSLFIFMLFVYVVSQIRDDYKGIKDLLKKIILFGVHIVLGVVMGLVVLLPSVLYIVKYSSRNTSNFEFLFNVDVYMKMIYRLFVYEPGSINLAQSMALDGSYHQNHFSYYIGLLSLYIVSFIFVLKDRTSKIYKTTIFIILIMMCIPVFSMLFSGVMVAYTRWFTYINIILLYYFAYVLSVIDFVSIEKKTRLKVLIGLITLFVVVFIYNLVMMALGTGKDITYYTYGVVFLLVFGAVGGMYLLFAIKQKKLIVTMVMVEMSIALALNISEPFYTSHSENIKNFNNVNALLSSVNLSNNFERVYLTNISALNSGRLTDYSSNEVTFHSFLPKYLYDFESLYSKEKNTKLSLLNLNNLSFNTKRIADYKYIVVEKNDDYGLGYLDKYYEDDKFIVYENKYYNSFYVYEDYYEKESVDEERLNKADFLHFSKMLFEGVVLEEDEYNLNKKVFNYSNSDSKILDFNHKTTLVKQGDLYVENVAFDYEYDGVVYISGTDLDELKSVYISSEEDKNKCYLEDGIYRCKFESGFDSLVFESEYAIEDFNYIISVEKDEGKYAYKNISEIIKGGYLNYYDGNQSKIVLVDDDGNTRLCTQDFCSLYDFSSNHILRGFSIEKYIENNKVFEVLYRNGNFDETDYDEYASGKQISQKGSTINIKYERTSNSENDQVIVLPVTYSDEWVCDDENYQIVKANGGFLGVIVKNNIKNIEVDITFKPSGVKIGFVGTCIGFCVYGLYLVFTYFKKKNEN